jgi:hypothetical protein
LRVAVLCLDALLIWRYSVDRGLAVACGWRADGQLPSIGFVMLVPFAAWPGAPCRAAVTSWAP